MPIILAVKTKNAINAAIEKDQGSLFRQNLKAAMQESIDLGGDAFRGDEGPFRSHLGASLIGRECPRELWYTFRWVAQSKFEGRMLRLFNRGHLEEPRFVAMLRTIDVKVWQYDESKHQFRVSYHGGHFGGSLDGVGLGCPDVPDEPVLLEFKTHGSNSFSKLVKEGVREAKPEHVVQMQTYSGGYKLRWALYMAVNKDNDDLHCELIEHDPEQYARYVERGAAIVAATKPPTRISSTPGWYRCRTCSFALVCHQNAEPARNCRTCVHSKPTDGGWTCGLRNVPLDKAAQLAACSDYRWIPM